MRLVCLLLMALLTLASACSPRIEGTPAPEPDAFFAPDFSMTTLDGQQVALRDFRGRWVVLNFWATWCAPCVEEMPALQALADEMAAQAVVLGINLREDSNTIRAFAAEHRVRFPLLLNPDDATVLAYTVVGLPQTVLIDPSGVVMARAFGPVNTAELIATITSRKW